MSEPVEWLPFPPKRPRGSRPPGWAPEAEAIITQVREVAENASAASDSSLASFVEDPASQTRAAIDEVAGGLASRDRLATLGTPTPKWFAEARLGQFIHYTFGGPALGQTVRRGGTIPGTVESLAAEFDAERVAHDLHAAGNEYVIFTAWHYAMHALYPSTVLGTTLPGHATTTTDGIRKLIDALKPYGIKLVLYVHPIDGHDLTAAEQAIVGWNDSTNNYEVWQNFINSLITELGLRYGTDIDGLWVDMVQDPGFTTRIADKARFRRSLLAGNPSRTIISNAGTTDNKQPSDYGNVSDFKTREYIGPPADINNWIAGYSHLAAIALTPNQWWASTAQGGSSKVKYPAADRFKFTVLQAGTCRTGGGMAWATSNYAGFGSTSVWEDGVEADMLAFAALLEPVAESIKGTIASSSYLTANTTTLATLAAGQKFVATRSADSTREYIHVLGSHSGSLTLPAPSDMVTFSSGRNVATGRPVLLSPLSGGGYTIALHPLDSWSSVHTAIELMRATSVAEEVILTADMFTTNNGALRNGQTLGSRFDGWTLSETTNMQIATTYRIPTHWATYDIDLYYGQAAAGEGIAVLDCRRAVALPGELLNIDVAGGGGGNIPMAGVANRLERRTIFYGCRNVPGAINHLRLARAATSGGDTGPSLAILQVVLRRTA